ncbi:MAG TPA: hypothetical protein VFP72_06910 [Kineosporiaceae bacterium]|nr:hypothetical protein [Kineosporiaceae bacterium]
MSSRLRAQRVVRRNGRGGQLTGEHFIAALRCLYRHAIADGLASDNPAARVDKPRRPASTRQAVGGQRLAEINQAAASTGNDPVLDSLLIRLHTETACRRGGALALRPMDLDEQQCLPAGTGRRSTCGIVASSRTNASPGGSGAHGNAAVPSRL